MGAMANLPAPLMSPAALIELGRSALGRALESAASLATVPVRLLGVLGQVELLVSRIMLITEQAEGLVQRVAAVAGDAEETARQSRLIAAAAAAAVSEAAAVTASVTRVVDSAAATTDAARAVVDQAATVAGEAATVAGAASAVVGAAGTAAGEARELLDGYSPTLRQAAPLAARFVSELTPDEVTAAIRMVDTLPRLRDHLVDDVMPLLSKLDQVGPDLHKLLEVTEDLHLAIAGLPGLKMLRRRGEDRIAEEPA
jgi:hypothetical protein